VRGPAPASPSNHADEAGPPGLTVAGPPLDLAAAAHKPVSLVLLELGSTQAGLTSDQAATRLVRVGRNVLASHKVTALGSWAGSSATRC
jgi:Cation transporter/ATPase, N-terminus